MPPSEDLGVTHTVHLWLVGKRVVDFLLVLIELFRQLSHYERILVEFMVLERGGWVTLSAISEGRGNEFWRQKTTVPVLSRGVVCVILRLAVLIQYRRVTHRHTDTL